MTVRSRLKVLLMEKNLERARAGQPALTVRQIAEQIGLATSTITGLTTNRVQRVDFGTLDTLCKFLNCTPGDVLEYIAEEQRVEVAALEQRA